MGAEGTTEREPIIIAWLDPDMPEDRHYTPQPHGNRLVGPRHISGSSANGCSAWHTLREGVGATLPMRPWKSLSPGMNLGRNDRQKYLG